jgi:hypothetical protein
VRLPAGYLRILETEADLFRSRRGRFLEMLLRRKLGELSFERPRHAPEYTISDEELAITKLWSWYVDPQTRKLVDEDRFQMGNLAVGTWAVILLNQWLGRPGGLRLKPPAP